MQENKAAREANYAHGLGGEYFFERESKNSLVNETEKEGVFGKPQVVCAKENLSLLFTYLSTLLSIDGPLGVSLRTLIPFLNPGLHPPFLNSVCPAFHLVSLSPGTF